MEIESIFNISWEAIVAICALAFAAWQQYVNIKQQRKFRQEEVLLQLSMAWNGPELLRARLDADPWLPAFPPGRDPVSWMSAQENGNWLPIGTVAHFLVNVEYLVRRKVIDHKFIHNHVGGGGRWARDLSRVYAAIGEEYRVVGALTSLEARYPPPKYPTKVRLPPPTKKFLETAKAIEFDASKWTGR